MSSLYHDPLTNPFQLNSSYFNKPLSQLDKAIVNVLSGNVSWLVRGSTPSTPASGYAKVYFKAGGLYTLDSAAVERATGGDTVRVVAFAELSGSQATIPVSSIPAGYRHLELKLRLRTDVGAVLDQVLVQFNADTTAANYNTASYDGSSLNTAVGTVAGVKIWSVPGASADANLFGIVDPLMVYDYISTTRYRVVDWRGVCIPSTSSATNYRALSGGGVWLNAAAAITSITLKPVAGSNFVAGSAYELLAVA